MKHKYSFFVTWKHKVQKLWHQRRHFVGLLFFVLGSILVCTGLIFFFFPDEYKSFANTLPRNNLENDVIVIKIDGKMYGFECYDDLMPKTLTYLKEQIQKGIFDRNKNTFIVSPLQTMNIISKPEITSEIPFEKNSMFPPRIVGSIGIMRSDDIQKEVKNELYITLGEYQARNLPYVSSILGEIRGSTSLEMIKPSSVFEGISYVEY